MLEALLAAQEGVKSVSLGYAEQGHGPQDVAAIRALRRLARRYLAERSFGDVSVHTVFHQYMGAFPADQDKSRALLRGSAATAAQSRATRLIIGEATAILDAALAAGRGDVAQSVIEGIGRGLVDVPFSPSVWNAGQAVSVRDSSGAVRFADQGRVSLPAGIRDHHRALVERRVAAERRHIEELMDDDVLRTARGQFDEWPLR